ncbi:hypothetical protein 2 [Soybean thrips rhabdo-like virus 2]|uniref:Matrix protein n=1 Tax=Soybean thrips rhabdo-like virus 2 TaxID=2802236 RepID=A0A7T8G231_9RHAB|nr:hypothetical protein 2 [Soybean thrips rhabdo-like virus 2]
MKKTNRNQAITMEKDGKPSMLRTLMWKSSKGRTGRDQDNYFSTDIASTKKSIGPLSVTPSTSFDMLLPTAPPAYETASQGYQGPTNVELELDISVRYRNDMDYSDLTSALKNLKRDFRGDLFMYDLVKFLLDSTVKNHFKKNPINRAMPDKIEGVLIRHSNTIACNMDGVSEHKFKMMGDSFKGSYKWITPYKGYCYFDLKLRYLPTETDGIRLVHLMK